MQKKLILLLVFSLTLFAFCGDKGADGKAGTSYLALNWVSLDAFAGFTQLPNFVYNGQYYEHSAGSFTGEYISSGWYWAVSYTIKVNPGKEGEEGGWISDGEDGATGDTRKYDLYLYSSGPSITSFDVPAVKKDTEDGKNALVISKKAIDTSLYDMSSPVQTITVTVSETLSENSNCHCLK